MSVEKKINLLWDHSNALNNETHVHRLLKSYYINTSRKLSKNKTVLPEEHYGKSKMCSHCGLQWHESEYQLNLQPQLVANNAKARKLIAKLEISQKENRKGLLTQKQRKRAKWLKKRVTSNIIITCEFCKHKTHVPLQKPKKRSKHAAVAPTQEEAKVVETKPPIDVKPKKKKKLKNKVKDKNAGLKINTAMTKSTKPQALTIPPLKSTTALAKPQNVTIASPDNAVLTKQKSSNVSIVATKKPQMTKPTKAQQTKPTAPTTKSKKQKKKQIQQKSHAIPTKAQSKSQQKNSLLALAALLKDQATKNATNSRPKGRLEKLLQ